MLHNLQDSSINAYRKDAIKNNSLVFQKHKTNRNVGHTYKYLILTNEESIKFYEVKLAHYKVPKLVDFRDSIPKSTIGKILRKVLRKKEKAKQKKQ